MKHLKNVGLNLVVGLLLVGTPVLGSVAMAAGGGTTDFTLTPNSGNYGVGSNITVQVYEDSGTDPVYSVNTNFTYSSNLSWDPSSGWVDGTTFQTDSQTTGGSGAIKISRSLGIGTPAVSGKNLVITLYFTVNAAGTATVNFDSGTNTQDATVYDPVTNPNPQLITYNANPQNATFNVPATPPPSGGSGTTNPPSSGGSSSKAKTSTPAAKSSTPAASTTPLVTSTTSFGGQSITVSGITTSNLSAYSATINWQTNVPATSQVNYGPTSDQLYFSNTDSSLSMSHSVKLSKANLLAGQTYYFTVKSADASGNVATSKAYTFKTVAPVTTPVKKNSSNTIIAFSVIGILAIAAIAGAIEIRRMHRRAKELDSHFLTGDPLKTASGPPTAAAGGGASNVIAPQNKNIPPTAGPK